MVLVATVSGSSFAIPLDMAEFIRTSKTRVQGENSLSTKGSNNIRSTIENWLRHFANPELSLTEYRDETKYEEELLHPHRQDPYVSDTVNNDGDKVILEVLLNGIAVQHQDGVDIVTAECEVEEGKEKQEEEQEKADSACEGSLTFDTGDYFRGEFQGGSLRNREGCLIKVSQGGSKTYGRWRNGLLQGQADFQEHGFWLRASYHQGQRHGLCRKMAGQIATNSSGSSALPVNSNFRYGLMSVENYHLGLPVGQAWQGLMGGAYLVGRLDPDSGKVCDKQGFYIYPDLCTAVRGRFCDGQLISGQAVTITEVGVNPSTWSLEITDCEPLGLVEVPERSKLLRADISTHSRLSKSPLARDAFEDSRVEVRDSGIENSGQGLFTKQTIKAGEIVALFNGVRKASSRNGEGPWSDYRIRLNGETDIDIPLEFVGLDKYCATLGHKANHSFSPNSRWSRLEHPRFGLICSITALRDICKGEEVLVNYGIGMAHAPQWYKLLWVRHLKNIGKTDSEIRDWCCRQYSMNGHVIELPEIGQAIAVKV